VLLVDCEQLADLDTTGAEEIISLKEELAGADVELADTTSWRCTRHSG
jgi:hypothetical protein